MEYFSIASAFANALVQNLSTSNFLIDICFPRVSIAHKPLSPWMSWNIMGLMQWNVKPQPRVFSRNWEESLTMLSPMKFRYVLMSTAFHQTIKLTSEHRTDTMNWLGWASRWENCRFRNVLERCIASPPLLAALWYFAPLVHSLESTCLPTGSITQNGRLDKQSMWMAISIQITSRCADQIWMSRWQMNT